jgi:hypothetical protein
MSEPWKDALSPEVQALALTGYDLECALHLVLTIEDAIKARALVGALVKDGTVTFGEAVSKGERLDCAVNIGLTHRGLYRLGLPQRHRDALELHAPAFCEGATPRAARSLGDTGASAAELWDKAFAANRADVLISIHGRDRKTVDRIADEISERPGAKQGFSGWKSGRIEAEHLKGGKDGLRRTIRIVHFDFRDNVTQPSILQRHAGSPAEHHVDPHAAGELLVGYKNDNGFDRWEASEKVPEEVTGFFRNGSFAVLRLIEQEEGKFNEWLREQSKRLIDRYPHATPIYLKAKMCGRWPNGALLQPGEVKQPELKKRTFRPSSLKTTIGARAAPSAHTSAAPTRATTRSSRRG